MNFIKSDVGIVTILTMVLFALVKFQDAVIGAGGVF